MNTRGLINGVTVCAKRGAKIKDIWAELSVYDFGTFENIFICVGGNDASKRTDTSQFEEKFDELLSFTNIANPECCVHVCQVLPRGDVDVSSVNTSIRRVVDHWKMHNVKCIEETYYFMFDRDGLPASRYYDSDGIHLAHPGIRRLLHAINGHVNIVDDFKSCVILSSRQPGRGMPINKSGQNRPYTLNGQPQMGSRQPHGPYSGNGQNTGSGSSNIPGAGTGNEQPNRRYTGNRQSYRPYTGNSQLNRPYMGYGRNMNGQSNGKWGGRKLCFGCSMSGHLIADCWYAQ